MWVSFCRSFDCFKNIYLFIYLFPPSRRDGLHFVEQDFILNLLVVDVGERMTAAIALNHPWMLAAEQELAERDLGKNLQQLRIFHATRKLRAAIKSVRRD